MRNLLISLCIVFSLNAANAAAPSDESIEGLLTAMRAEKTMEAVFANLDQVMRQSMAAATQGQTPSAEQQRIFDSTASRFVQILRDEMSWANMKPLYVQIYRESFSEEEIAGLVAFYKSPAGVAYIEKMPVVLQKSMTIMQTRMGPMMEKMKVAVQQAVEEAKAAK